MKSVPRPELATASPTNDDIACFTKIQKERKLRLSGWQTILKLTAWLRGTYLSTLGRTRARSHQIGEIYTRKTVTVLDSGGCFGFRFLGVGLGV